MSDFEKQYDIFAANFKKTLGMKYKLSKFEYNLFNSQAALLKCLDKDIPDNEMLDGKTKKQWIESLDQDLDNALERYSGDDAPTAYLSTIRNGVKDLSKHIPKKMKDYKKVLEKLEKLK